MRAGLAASHRQVLGASFPRVAWIVSSPTQRTCAVTTGAAHAVTARSARDGRMDSRNCADRLTITQAGKSTARTNVCGTRVSGDPGAASFPGGPAAATWRLTLISLGKTLPNVERQRGTRETSPETIRALGRAGTPVRTPRTAGAHPPANWRCRPCIRRILSTIADRSLGVRPPSERRASRRSPCVRAPAESHATVRSLCVRARRRTAGVR